MQLYNTLTQKLETFTPNHSKHVTLYVCGITPYDTTHLGHAFTYISFDVLVRYLTFSGYKVTYTQNVTDINDRDKDILERAREQHTSWKKLAAYWTKRFLKDMHALNWIMPTHYIKASQSITPIIDLIQKLLQHGLAYEVNKSIYLDTAKVKNFGKLSRLSYKQMIALAKVFEEDLDNKDKKNRLDITLWRASGPTQPKHIPSFKSPFGKGRPGWHIECSAMSISTLGEQIDIHGGGTDLIFPHHESEIAQSQGATQKSPFAKYWIHTEQVSYRGKKMSKSKGNLVMISDLLKRYSPNAIRWVLLSHHYQKPWDFKEKDLKTAEKTLQNMYKNLQQPDTATSQQSFDTFTKLMDGNLNTPKVLTLIAKASKNRENRFVAKALQILGFTLLKPSL